MFLGTRIPGAESLVKSVVTKLRVLVKSCWFRGRIFSRQWTIVWPNEGCAGDIGAARCSARQPVPPLPNPSGQTALAALRPATRSVPVKTGIAALCWGHRKLKVVVCDAWWWWWW